MKVRQYGYWLGLAFVVMSSHAISAALAKNIILAQDFSTDGSGWKDAEDTQQDSCKWLRLKNRNCILRRCQSYHPVEPCRSKYNL
jgi:hypothetical protein